MESIVEPFGHLCTINGDGGRDKFRNLRLKAEYSTDDDGKKRGENSKIIQIIAADGLLFSLAQSGICTAFNLGLYELLNVESNEKICILNLFAGEFIRSLFYDKLNESLITDSVWPTDYYNTLKFRTIKIECIRSREPGAGIALFESELLSRSASVVFDDLNGKIIIFSADNCVFKVFDMRSYRVLFSIPSSNIEEITISQGVILLIFTKAGNHVPLEILSIEDGTSVKSFNHLLHSNEQVDFFHLFNEKLLIKQKNINLQILDVNTCELVEVSNTKFVSPLIFLYEKQTFLMFENRTVSVWNSQGELVTSFEDHLLWHPGSTTNVIHITDDHDFILSYCKADSDDQSLPENGSINVSNIVTGKCVGKIKSSETLNGITALYYDERRKEVYTGNKTGLVHVWLNHSIDTPI